MPASFVVYIDESGDEGFKFGDGSSDWFVLSAVITRKGIDLETVKLVDAVRTELGKPPKSPLHFKDLKHEARIPYVAAIAKAGLRVISILTHKPSLRSPETFREPNVLYFYMGRYLLERVSWYCRDHRPPGDRGDGSAEIIFSNREGLPYSQFREYLTRLENQSASMDVKIDWSVIKQDSILAISPMKRMGLLIADAVSGSFYRALQPSRFGYVEDRYARMLKPVVYHYGDRYEGYGLKFWPPPNLSLTNDEAFSWLRDAYQIKKADPGPQRPTL